VSAGADGRGEPGRGVRVADPVQDGVVVAVGERVCANATGDEDNIGVGELVKCGVDHQAEEAIVCTNLALALANEGDRGLGQSLKNLIRPNRVGDLVEEWNRDLHVEVLVVAYGGRMAERTGDEASTGLSEVWAAFAEVDRQLSHATDADVRLDLKKVKEELRAQLAQLREEMKPTPTRRELEDELDSRERQLNKIFNARINTMTQTAGDGASPGGYGVGAQEMNAAIDERFGRAAVERRILELRAAIEALDAEQE